MARRGRRPTFGKEITANLKFDPASLKKFEQALLELMNVADPETVDEALMAGAQIVKRAQESRAPGPHIGIELVKNLKALQKGSASKNIKANMGSGARYIAIGPEKKYWYYRFFESGVKPHGVSKRKRTRSQQATARSKVKRADAGKKVKVRPMMSWMQGGKRVFARQVRGFSAKPFVEPSVAENQAEITAAMGDVLRKEILKAITG